MTQYYTGFIKGTRSSSLTTELGRATRTQAHMATREFILTVLVLYSIATSLVLAQNETTYLRELPSGRTVLCERCPPGYHLLKHCTETQRTVCQPCNVEFFTEYWNYIYDCLPCNWCSSEQVTVRECMRTSNRVCACKEGFYWDMFFCRPHTVCSNGYRVKEKGTANRDTVCVPHTKCKAEEKLLFCGTNYTDNVCVTCSHINLNGWVKSIEQAFIEIFKNHKSQRFHNFIGNLTNLNGHRVSRNVMDHDDWIRQLQQWFSKATEQDVIHLPKLLRKQGLKSLAKKIGHIVKRIQDEVILCRNGLD